MMSVTIILLHSLLLNLIHCCIGYKLLLVFPVPSRSHAILGEGYVRHLVKAGHEVTYITALPMKNPPRGVRQIDVSENRRYMPVETIFDTRSLINQELDMQDVTVILGIFPDFANRTLHIDAVQKLLHDPKEEFDAVIIEWMYTEIFSGMAAVFNCPLIWSSSMEPHSLILPLIDEYPNPAYTFHNLSRDYGFNFWQRVYQLWITLSICFCKWRSKSRENQMYVSIYENIVNNRGRSLPSYEDVRYNGSIILGNSHIATGEAISLPHNFKPIGGYHIDKDVKPLPTELQSIMDNAKHGVIYFSMGSILQSHRMPENLKRDIINVFGALNQTVIWKLEQVLMDLPKNVHILPWAPQTSILAHSNCVLFITHGGHLSQTEALYFGVPMIGIPLYADQFVNTNRAESRGFVKRVDLYHDGPKKLNLAIREILENSSYRMRAKEYSFIFHHRPSPPEKELVHWVEHVIKTRGAMHLRSPALRVSWYQKYYLDLAAVILLLSIIIVRLFKEGWIVYRRYFKEKLL